MAGGLLGLPARGLLFWDIPELVDISLVVAQGIHARDATYFNYTSCILLILKKLQRLQL